ncbi:MAG: hypothetical protein IPJ25_04760 [Rhodocyclaceae bacterium]|nr:hypothetical protein [Rhodocyclaceae bacterium]
MRRLRAQHATQLRLLPCRLSVESARLTVEFVKLCLHGFALVAQFAQVFGGDRNASFGVLQLISRVAVFFFAFGQIPIQCLQAILYILEVVFGSAIGAGKCKSASKSGDPVQRAPSKVGARNGSHALAFP